MSANSSVPETDHVCQTVGRGSRCCCRPFVGDIRTRSSTNSRHLTSVSSRVRQGPAECSRALASSLMYILNRVGLPHPPTLTEEICVCHQFNCEFVVRVHRFDYGVCFSTNAALNKLE
ncbi:hypothetical protein AMELA_G00058550 [Ameiurus melas]|uniref:Uncharacterized protein n=1 Tax=Ameiurus melas TaxID=219545 RepID=A0A7J6B4V9_AMEME|nr:hypothetical protein AMELA_G00058550 [Ameiurus melas]